MSNEKRKNFKRSYSQNWILDICHWVLSIPALQEGQSLVELLLVMGLSAILVPALFTGAITSRNGRAQQDQRVQALELAKEGQEAARVVKDNNWDTFIIDGTYHPVVSGTTWILAAGSENINGFTRQIVVSPMYRDNTGSLTTSPGTLDPSVKQVTTTVSWANPIPTSVSLTSYFTRFGNADYTQTTVADFSPGIQTQTQVTNLLGGEVKIANDNKGKWCSPAFSKDANGNEITITLPDGPPVAVAATASATTSIPNDVFVATAPYATSSVKLAYVTVTANTATPSPSLKGTFTLDSTKYSNGTFPNNIGLNNNFKTNDVKFYKEANGKIYALLATDLPDHELIVVQINDGSGDAFQDPVNHIYKYWTFFNTRQYQGDVRSTPNQDQAPFGYGASSITILGTRAYIDSGGFLYTIDLSNIDSKSTSTGLDEIGCRIQLDGFDCQPGNGTDKKYSSGQTGTTWSTTTSAAHLDCSDGGNIELNADHQLSAVQVGANTYVYVAVGAGTDPELDIADVTSIPTANSNPKINANSCGTTSGNSGWKVVGSLDFDPVNGTEEAANSVYAKSDGTRAYMASNGGIDANHDGIPDSDQFYVIDTTNKTAPKFLSSNANGTAKTGFYNGTGANLELFPRRSLTVLNGSRAVLVGQDGIPNDGIEPQEYQVLNMDTNGESAPTYCNGLNYLPGFNDLTSVSEADGDNYLYLVANTNEKQLKIIEGGPDDAIFDPSGTFESATFTATADATFNYFTPDALVPSGTTLTYQVAIEHAINNSCSNVVYNYVGPDGTANTTFATGSAFPISLSGSGYVNPGACMRYKAFFTSSDQTQTPILYDMNVNYSP